MRSKLQSQEIQHEQKQRSKFLPLLCSSSSSKEVKLSHRRCPSSLSSASVSEEPSSPRVGCMGEVKRNNKVDGFPSIISFNSSLSSSNNNNNGNLLKSDLHRSNGVKYHKLRSLFSGRSLTGSPTGTGGNGTHKCKIVRNRSASVVNSRGRETAGVDHHHLHHHGRSGSRIYRSMTDENMQNIRNDQKRHFSVNLEELDPPLPVVTQVEKKQEEGSGGERMNLWKRRSGGAPLKTLQLQSIKQSNTLVSANTV